MGLKTKLSKSILGVTKRSFPYFFQPKLVVNQPDDVYEREADGMADQVMRMTDTSINHNSFFKSAVSSIQRKRHHCEEEEKLHRKENSETETGGSDQLDSYVTSLGSSGQPLPATSRRFFEPRFGRDFSDVRVHADSVAAKSAHSINALAYTTGNNIVFNDGQFSPDSDSGKRLMAHELTHVVQQSSAISKVQKQDALQIGIRQLDPPKNILQRDAGGVRQSQYGDIDVDIIQGDIEAAKWQDAFDLLTPMTDSRVMEILAKLRDIIDSSNFTSLTLLKRNKPAGVQARFDALMFRADNYVGLNPTHADEQAGTKDKLELQTFATTGDQIQDVILKDKQIVGQPSVKTTLDKEFSIFLPKGMPPDRNEVHIFFTPYVASNPDGAASFVAEQGLRAQSDASGWILIAVPALGESDQPNFVTISTTEVQQCLTAAGRPTNIDAIRLSAHSRGHRGLENTMGLNPGSTPLIDLKLVEKITVFDASYHDLGQAINSHKKELTAMADPNKPGQFKAGAVQLYDVTVANISGLKGTSLDPRSMRALSYTRMIKEGLTQGLISANDLNTALPQKILDATNNVLSVMPVRGTFSSKTPPPSGQVSIQQFYKDNHNDLMLIDSKEIKAFIGSKALDNGHGFSTDIDAHHWFVAELAHEAVE